MGDNRFGAGAKTVIIIAVETYRDNPSRPNILKNR